MADARRDRKGALLVSIRYVGRHLQAVYPKDLAHGLANRVFHSPKCDAVVECPIIGASQKDEGPATRWDPEYVWPLVQATPSPTEAPVQKKTEFVAAAQAFIAAIDSEIVAHLRTHDLDPVVEIHHEVLQRLLETMDGS